MCPRGAGAQHADHQFQPVRIIKTNVLVRPRASPQEVESEDYAVYVEASAPSAARGTIRDVIVADVDQIYFKPTGEAYQQDVSGGARRPARSSIKHLAALRPLRRSAAHC
jgi:hypothetical protein